MIRTDRLALDTGTFAAERRTIMNDAMEKMETPVRYSTMRLGLPRWEEHIVAAAVEIFETTARAEVDEWSQVLDDLLDDFQRELRAALAETKTSSDPDRQRETLARWVSTMAVNAGTEAATTADPDDGVGLEWVTMGDADVRHSHQETAGQTVPTGMAFTVGEVEMLYPGQPVGAPENWINCRCTVRPTMLTKATSNTITASADEAKHTSSVLVALPAADDAVHSLGQEESHVTLLFFGDAAAFDPQGIKDEVAAYLETSGPAEPVIDNVSGTAVLGEDKANVLLLDARNLADIRGAILASEAVRAVHDTVEQYPAWIPHLTIGYPDDPEIPTSDQPFSPDATPIPDTISFDRLALWHGDEQTEFPFKGSVNVVADSSDQQPVMSAELSMNDQPADDPAEPNSVPEEGTPDEPPMLDDDEADLPVPWHGVLAPEGVPSGDGRQFAVDSLTNRALPLPLKYMPADAAGHDGSVVCGRIDKIWREDGEIRAEGVFDHSEWGYEAVRQIAEKMIRGVSVDVDAVEASVDTEAEDAGVMEFSAARIAAATLCAIPAFAEAWVALGPWQEINEEDVETEDVEDPEFTAAVGAFTATATFAPDLEKAYTCNYCKEPATKYIHHSEGMAYTAACDEHFEQAKTDAETSTPGGERDPSNIVRIYDLAATTAQFKHVPQKTKDGPGWITNPKPTHKITDYWVDGTGAAKIGWGAPGDFNRCRTQLVKYVQNPQWLAGLCANLHYRALGVWPGQEGGKGVAAADGKSLTASVAFAPSEQIIMPVEAFVNPMLEQETPFTITEDGRVFGHLATWNVCHIGIGEACVNAPPSQTDYAYFLTGKVLTDAGPVAVGQVSLGGGHASGKYGVRGAVAHYDSTSAAVADITVGEDATGVWCAGVLRPGTTPEQVYALRAAVLSGDWREVIVNGESNLELVAALAVNVPGYPIPRPTLVASAAGQTALIAASIAQGDKPVVDTKQADVVVERRDTELAAALNVLKNFHMEGRNQKVQAARRAIVNGKA